MQIMTANEAKTHFGEFIERAQREPVQVMRHNRVVGVLVSAHDYEGMRTYYANRLNETLDEVGQEAVRRGLTEQELDRLLSDES